MIVSSARDGTVRLWDSARREQLASLSCEPVRPRSAPAPAARRPSTPASGLFNLSSLNPAALLRGGGGSNSSVSAASERGGPSGSSQTPAASADAFRRAMVRARGRARVLALPSPSEVFLLTVDTKDPFGTLRVWDLRSGAVIARARVTGGRVTCAAWLTDRELVIAFGKGRIELWTVEVEGLGGPLDAARVRVNAGHGITAEPRFGEAGGIDPREAAMVNGMYTHRGHHPEQQPGQQQQQPGQQQQQQPGLGGESAKSAMDRARERARTHAAQLALPATLSAAASGLTGGEAGVAFVRNSEVLFTGHAGKVFALGTLDVPGGAVFVTVSTDRTLRVWDGTTGERLAVLTTDTKTLAPLAFVHGRTVITLTETGTMVWWSVSPLAAECARLGVTRSHTRGVNAGVFAKRIAADGRARGSLFTASDDTRVILWDVETRERVATFVGHARPVLAVAVSSDARVLATGSESHTVRVWNVASRECLRVLKGHRGAVVSVAFDAAGHRSGGYPLLSSGEDCDVRLWEVSDCRDPDTGFDSDSTATEYGSDDEFGED
jgi:WD40 repeat protein